MAYFCRFLQLFMKWHMPLVKSTNNLGMTEIITLPCYGATFREGKTTTTWRNPKPWIITLTTMSLCSTIVCQYVCLCGHSLMHFILLWEFELEMVFPFPHQLLYSIFFLLAIKLHFKDLRVSITSWLRSLHILNQ